VTSQEQSGLNVVKASVFRRWLVTAPYRGEQTTRLTGGHDLILVNGVLMYVNDDDLRACLNNVKQLLSDGGLLYIKESVSYGKRLTLDQIYSEELAHDYSAIYRSIAEYETLWDEYFPAGEGWEIVEHGEVWENALGNRRETTAYFWLVRRRP